LDRRARTGWRRIVRSFAGPDDDLIETVSITCSLGPAGQSIVWLE